MPSSTPHVEVFLPPPYANLVMARPKIARFCTPAIVDRSFAVFIRIILLGVVLRYCWLDARDPFKCGAMLNEGEWLDQPPINSSIVPTNWQPRGCMMRKYSSNDVSTCLANRRVLFIGDSTIRQVFWSVAKALDPGANPSLAGKHVDITVEKSDVTLEFIWDPWLNSSRLHTELSSYNGENAQNEVGNIPALMLMGCGLWYARHENLNGLKMWKDNIDDVVQHMGVGRRTTDMTGSDLLLLSPVTVPAWAKLSGNRKATITPQKILAMNQYLQQLSDFQGIDVIRSWQQMTYNLPQTMESSGIHVVESIAARQADALLNLRCNSVTVAKYPLDNTCCNRYQAPNHIQWLGLLFVLVILPAIIYFRQKDSKNCIARATWLPFDPVVSALFSFGLVVVYCFYADRTGVFNKSHKQFFPQEFFWSSAILLTLGLFSIRKSSPTDTDQPFLSRDQTNEWKGWMQFTILIYHYTDASTESAIYGFVRVAVAAYLFMTGFGHTFYFLKTKDYSFKRLAGVLTRLNLLSCVLPFMMGTNYLFYYFAPLCSYWFLVVYGTMRAGEKYNSNTIFLLVKIFLAAILSAAITSFPGLLEAAFNVFGFVTRTEWDPIEWRFRVSLDMWIVFVGMLVATVFVRVNERSSYAFARWAPARRYAVVASSVALPLFFLFQMTRETKYVYNAYHPYVSFIPILSFIVLRNATPRLRNAHSRLFAWLGKMSLVTFTLQFHIWMAADTKGLLDLGVFGMTGRGKNFIFSTTLFLYASYRVAGATRVLVRWIIGEPVESMPGASYQVGFQALGGSDKGIAVEEGVPLALRSSIVDSTFCEFSDDGIRYMEDEDQVGCWGNLRFRMATILLVVWVLSLTY